VNDIVVLCDAPSHGKRVRVGVLERESGPSAERRAEFLERFGAEPDASRHRERRMFRCSRCGDSVTVGRPETLAKIRARLSTEDDVTLRGLRCILMDK
jgi:hypothetical protein